MAIDLRRVLSYSKDCMQSRALMRAVILDLYPASTREMNVLLAVYESGIPKEIKSHAYTQIAGGKITNIETPNNSQVYIASNGDVVLTGANAGDINLTAYRKRIDIQGPNVHANNINVGPETDYLKVEFEGRDFTTNYTNILIH